jgi:autotransporter-associated beta strand protein
MTANMAGRLGANVTLRADDNLVPGVQSYCSLAPYDTAAGYWPQPYALTVTATNTSRTAAIRSGWAYGTGTTLDLTNRVAGVCVGGSDQGGTLYFQPGSALWDDRIKFVLSGDNSGLTGPTNRFSGGAGSAAIVGRNGYIIANHANALGSSNTLAVQIGQMNSADAGSPGGLLATNGITVNANIYVKNNNSGTPQPALADLGLTGSGTATFTRDIAIQGVSGSEMTLPMVRLTAGAGGTARFTGNIYDRWGDPKQGPIIVCGLGDVALAGANTWNNKGDGSVSQGRVTIRSGRLLVENDAALGKTNLAVKVGDTVPRVTNVRVATRIGVPSVSAWSAGTYTFSAVPTIDGVQPALGDRVLVKDEVYDSQRHGVYEVTAADQKTWTRAGDMDAASEFAYGTRVVATNGTFNAGKAFYLVNKQDVYGAAFTVNTTKVGFNPEPAAEPDAALLTGAAVTVANPVEVLANRSAGKVTLGGATAHVSAFGSAVSLARDVELTAAANGKVTFAGVVSGAGGVTKVGAGVVRLANAGNSYAGGTSIRVTAGELAAGAKLEVAGTLDLSGADDALTVSGTLDRNTTYTLASYGTLNGTFDTVTGLGKHTVRYDGPGNTIQIKAPPTESMIVIR